MLRMGKHEGTIRLASGSFLMSGDQIQGGTFQIDMNSIQVTDMPAHETQAIANLTGHLKSEDFFAINRYPLSNFTIKEINSDGQVMGILTMRGISHKIAFEVDIELFGKNELLVKGNLTLDRQKWEVSFKGLKDMAVDDTIFLRLEVYTQERQSSK